MSLRVVIVANTFFPMEMHKIEIIYVDTHKYKHKHKRKHKPVRSRIKISNVVLRRRSRWRGFMDSSNIIPDIIPDIILLPYHNEGRKRRGCIFAPDK